MMPDGELYPRSAMAMISLPNLLFGDDRFSSFARSYESLYFNSVNV